jgi:hypothetical protein
MLYNVATASTDPSNSPPQAHILLRPVARPPSKHLDPVVADLQAIRRLDWARPREFKALTTLLSHPLVERLAEEPKDHEQRVKALKSALQQVVSRIKEKEGENPPLGRSVAAAGTALLRLTPEFAEMPLKELRQNITASWAKKGGGKVSVNGFRQHLEVPEVYEPLAAEFRRMAREKADASSEADDQSETSPIKDVLATMEKQRYQERLANLNEGFLRITDEKEMFEVLRAVVKGARSDCRAVDDVDIAEWFSSRRLREYLDLQLRRVSEGQIKLERIRFVKDREIHGGGRSQEQLDELITLHEEAGADLFLCPEEELEKSGLRFSPQRGMFLVDAETAPVAVTGELAKDGSIGMARIYLNWTEEVGLLKREYDNLRSTAVRTNRELRLELSRFR